MSESRDFAATLETLQKVRSTVADVYETLESLNVGEFHQDSEISALVVKLTDWRGDLLDLINATCPECGHRHVRSGRVERHEHDVPMHLSEIPGSWRDEIGHI